MFGPHLPRSFRSTAHASARRARVGAVPGVAWAVPQICDLKNPNSVTGQIFAWRLSRGSNALPSVELQTPQMRSIEAEANSSAGPGTERERECAMCELGYAGRASLRRTGPSKVAEILSICNLADQLSE